MYVWFRTWLVGSSPRSLLQYLEAGSAVEALETGPHVLGIQPGNIVGVLLVAQVHNKFVSKCL